jgi:hypothetical protein
LTGGCFESRPFAQKDVTVAMLCARRVKWLLGKRASTSLLTRVTSV